MLVMYQVVHGYVHNEANKATVYVSRIRYVQVYPLISFIFSGHQLFRYAFVNKLICDTVETNTLN